MNSGHENASSYFGLPIATATHMVAIFMVTIGIVLVINTYNSSPFNDYQIAMLVFAGVNIFMGPLVFVSVTKGWPTGLRLYSLLTCICMAFAGTALVFTIWSQLDVQSFLASYNWFDATRPEADQELNARFVLAVYSVGIIAYFAFLIFALFVVEQHRKYILAVPNSEEQI